MRISVLTFVPFHRDGATLVDRRKDAWLNAERGHGIARVNLPLVTVFPFEGVRRCAAGGI